MMEEMEYQRLTLTADKEGERVDAYLARQREGLSRSAAQRLIEEGYVSSGDRLLKKNDKLQVGQVVICTLPPVKESPREAEDIPLVVLYEDADVIVVDKPVGLVVHPAPGHPGGTLVNGLLHHCGESLSGIGGQLRPGIVHRIDRDTSGLLIVAKNDAAHLHLSAQLQDHSLYREYETLVIGGMKEEEGRIHAPIGRHSRDRKRMAIVREGGKEAITHWKVLARYEGISHLSCRLETGRTHQIRVHLASVGHPVLGDRVYGNSKGYPGLAGQCLHARRLSFLHPKTQERIQLESPLPDYFETIIKKLCQKARESE